MFAMTWGVASLIASLTLSQVRSIAVANAGQLQVRWDTDPELRRDLLIACRSADEPELAAIRCQAKLGGELIPPNARETAPGSI